MTRSIRKFSLLATIFLIALQPVSQSVYAQHNWPPVYELQTDTVASFTLPDSNWQMLGTTDKVGLKEIETIPYSSKFYRKKFRQLSYKVNTYWQRYRIRNTLNHPVRVVIAEGKSYATIFYRLDKGNWQQEVTGALVPWSKRDGLKKITSVIMTIPAGETMWFYERNVFDYRYTRPFTLVVSLSMADSLLLDAYSDSENSEYNFMLGAFIAGLLLFAAILNFFFFSAVRERVYLFYGLTLLSAMLKSEVTPLLGFYREHPLAYYHLGILFFSLQFFFFVQTNRYFINLKQYYPKWDGFLSRLNVLTVFVFLLAQLVFPYFKPEWSKGMFIIYTILSINVFISLLVTLLIFSRKKDFNSRTYVISALPMVISILLEYVSSVNNRWAFSIWYTKNYQVIATFCIVWLLFLFTWSLIKRFSKLRQENAQKEIDKERFAKQKEIEKNELIASQKIALENEVAERTIELKQSIENLKATQSQLIQSEKMASLGELTAGIAHEIQNPLNFVNNFSEVNTELIDELVEELEKGDVNEIKALAKDIKENEQKIRHHGKRADAIVKGMLQHSRSGSENKEATDINALADEYLRLSYHGLRAKDKDFNAKMETSYDPGIGKIEILPQDVGRVLLNIFTNAFYSVSAKKKANKEGYEPTVTLVTKLISEPAGSKAVELTIRDNGTGIPQSIIDKIYQPFFTTKPTGEGTGLGLSMSYDIITKSHGGEMKVSSEEGEFAEFIIILPV